MKIKNNYFGKLKVLIGGPIKFNVALLALCFLKLDNNFELYEKYLCCLQGSLELVRKYRFSLANKEVCCFLCPNSYRFGEECRPFSFVNFELNQTPGYT